ncbi:MAG: pyridoxamine 5'-phosphate oxidase family protein [Deltaproteobacteria bacterium]|nr:pyridoxamine 5'-phosphate oxidase family protein [Deltaproteobacteria bacterium]
MAQFFDALSDDHRAFIAEQHLFFVATACADGRVNLSPKGMDTLRVLDDRTVAYLDLTGSGNETAAHLAADGRITMMLTSFGKKPLILRLYGRGDVVRPGDAAWEALAGHFTLLTGTRQIIRVAIDSVQTSCGYAVPRYELVAERQTLVDWADRKGPDGLIAYRRDKNRRSIDGKPAYPGDELL